MKPEKRDFIVWTVLLTILITAICAVGGLEHPNTLAGKVSRFVFSTK